jgi:hypothetical protein
VAAGRQFQIADFRFQIWVVTCHWSLVICKNAHAKAQRRKEADDQGIPCDFAPLRELLLTIILL